MPYILAGVLVLWLVIPALRRLTRVKPMVAAVALRTLVPLGLFGASLILLSHGSVLNAAVTAFAAVWLSGKVRFIGLRFKPSAAANMPRASRIRTAMIEMELDPGSGELRGVVLAGRFQDRTLGSLDPRECMQLLSECAAHDTKGERLLEAYLDRRFAGWRAAKQDDVDSRSAGLDRRSSATGPMSHNEAYEVLGLDRGASRDEVSRAHRTLMKKLHPDQGGSTQLAARVNEAKDLLLRRHH